MRLIIAPKERRSRERDFQPSYLQKSPIPRGATYGGNTSCVELRQDGSILSLDAGSGLRELGLSLTAQDKSFETEPFSILVTHFHWDHIQGFPFFEPCYRAENRILIASALAGVEEAFRAQMAPPFFPKPLDELPATVTFKLLPVGEGVELGAFRVRAISLAHPNGATGYRVEGGGASLVYLTDTELAATDPQMQQAIKEVRLERAAEDYVLEIVTATRSHAQVYLGASPRGSLSLSRAAQALAAIQGLDYVLPDHIKRLAPPVLAHRLIIRPVARIAGTAPEDVVREIVAAVPVD
jgi:glyoxylase-like metal-dependent hydrolase (beta-lactamase superfamily II)